MSLKRLLAGSVMALNASLAPPLALPKSSSIVCAPAMIAAVGTKEPCQ
jgi:hypothetical protein